MRQFNKREAWRSDYRPHNGDTAKNRNGLCAFVMCPRLDWPFDLFAQNKDLAFMPLEKLKSEFLCACGCQQRHNCAVSRVVRIDGDRRVLWYLSMRCLNKHAGLIA